jgi:hypothetical protein
MTARVFLHTLSFPEVLWLNFWREFFQQKTLIVDDDGTVIDNNFHIDLAKPTELRKFDVTLFANYDDSKPNALPLLVIEDTGMVQLGITTNQLKTWSVSPNTIKERADLTRSTYIFHCLAKDRGESRLLAAIITFAVTCFRDQLLKSGFHKIEPWSVGATQPLRNKAGEDYVDTPVSITFYTTEFWNTLTKGTGTAEDIGFIFSPDTKERFIRAFAEIADPVVLRFIRASAIIQNPNLSRFIRASAELENPTTVERFIRAGGTIQDPTTVERFIRAQLRVSG